MRQIEDIPIQEQRISTLQCNLTSHVLWKDANIENWRCFWGTICVAQKDLKNAKLRSELSTLNKIIYKHQNQMRRNKSFQVLKKVQLLAVRFLNMDLFEYLDKYQEYLNKFLKKNSGMSNQLEVPTIKFTCYILERMIGGSKLLSQVLPKLEDVYRHLAEELSLGHFVTFNVFAIAAISRIKTQLNEIREVLCKLYPTFLSISEKIYNGKRSYPDTLIWNENKNKNMLTKHTKKEKKVVAITAESISFESSDRKQLFEPTIKFEEAASSNSCIQIQEKIENSPNSCLDIGEVLSRSSEVLQRQPTVKQRKTECQLCGRRLRTLSPSLTRSSQVFHRTILSFSHVKNITKWKLRHHLIQLKHYLLHSRTYRETCQYRYLIKCVRITLKKKKK